PHRPRGAVLGGQRPLRDPRPGPGGRRGAGAPRHAARLLDALRTTGVMPVVPLSFDPAQGWVQLDPATGFPVGRILAGPEDECRIAATGAPADGTDPLRSAPRVLTVCSAEDGSMTA